MRLFVAAVLVISPFLLGLNRPQAWLLALVAVLAAAVLRPQAFPPWPRRHLHPGIASTLALAAAALLAFAIPVLQVAGGTCGALPSPLPCMPSLDNQLQTLTIALLLWLWFALLVGPMALRTDTLLAIVVIAGGVQAIYALSFHFLGLTPFFMEGLFRHEGHPTGGFTNRNHMAAFTYLCIFAGIALILRLPGDTGAGRAARWRLLLDRRMLWRLLLVLMVLALIGTRSRAGNAAFVIGLLAGLAWLLLVERRRAHGHGKPLRWRFVTMLVLSVLVIDALLVGSFLGLERLQERIADTTLEGEARTDVNRALLEHPDSFTALGHGSGGFAAVFERIKPAHIWGRYNHAHNDYLQALVERGWVGGGLALAAIGALLAAGLRQQRPPRDGDAAVRFALVAGTTALLVHATVEFVTQIPAIWLCWLVLVALAVRAAPRANRSPVAGRP